MSSLLPAPAPAPAPAPPMPRVRATDRSSSMATASTTSSSCSSSSRSPSPEMSRNSHETSPPPPPAPRSSSSSSSSPPVRHEWDRLLVACQKGQAAEVKRLIGEEGIDPNHSNVIQQSALHVAAWWARADCLRALLETNNVNVHAQNTLTGATPLHCSLQSSPAALVKSQRLACLALLLTYGANPQTVDFSNRTPLEYLDEGDIDRQDIERLIEESQQPKPSLGHQAIQERDLAGLQAQLDADGSADAEVAFTKDSIVQEALWELLLDWCDEERFQDDDDTFQALELSSTTFFEPALDVLLSRLPSAAAAATTTRQLGGSPTASNAATVATVDPPPSASLPSRTGADMLCHAILQRYKTCRSVEDGLVQVWIRAVDQFYQHSLSASSSSSGEEEEESSCTWIIFTDTTKSHWLELGRRNYLELAQQFEKWQITPNAVVNRQGMTPLHFAARSGHLDMVQLLWRLVAETAAGVTDPPPQATPPAAERVAADRREAFLTHIDDRGHTALDAARVNGHGAVVQWMLSVSSSTTTT